MSQGEKVLTCLFTGIGLWRAQAPADAVRTAEATVKLLKERGLVPDD